MKIIGKCECSNNRKPNFSALMPIRLLFMYRIYADHKSHAGTERTPIHSKRTLKLCILNIHTMNYGRVALVH